MSLLNVEHIQMQFGGILALEDTSLTVEAGTVTSLIGPNGAGKTTLFNCLTGFYHASKGEIRLQDSTKSVDILELLGRSLKLKDCASPATLLRRVYYKMFGGTHLVNQAGIARTFQNIRLFNEMSVLENLLVAQHAALNTNPLAGLLNLGSYKKSEKDAINTAYEWLAFTGLTEHANRLAGELAYGLQRKLEIARAMCTSPKLICLDEPAAGLNPAETEELKQIIEAIRSAHNTTVLLIEHDMRLVMDISDHIYVLDHGQIIADGNPEAIQANKKVIAAYLGLEE